MYDYVILTKNKNPVNLIFFLNFYLRAIQLHNGLSARGRDEEGCGYRRVKKYVDRRKAILLVMDSGLL